MNSNLPRLPISSRIKPQVFCRDRPADGDNSALLGLGCQVADRITLQVGRGVAGRAALRGIAADLGLDVAEARHAVRFKEAVDRIAGNVGDGAREAILAGGRHLTPKRVMQVSRTHPDRQRYAMAQIAQGRHPFAKPRDGSAPPFDTLGYGEVGSRVARTTGALDRVGRGLATTAAEGWPPGEKLDLMTGHLDQVRSHCSTLIAVLDGHGTRAGTRPAVAEHARNRRPGRATRGPATFRPGGALGFVAAARGIADKNVRDLPRLLRESPPTEGERASLLDRLRVMDSAARKLAESIRGYGALETPRPPARRSGPTGDSSAASACGGPGVPVEEAIEDPSALGGTYVVVFLLDADATVTVGKLGTFAFPAGFYAYVGSAFGPGGVRARTTRHRTQDIARKKWNIDHMKPPLRATEVWWTNDTIKRECGWSATLATIPGFTCPAADFGSHDCGVNRSGGYGSPGGRLCEAHLYHSLQPPDVQDFARRLGLLVPDHAPVYRQRLNPGERGVIVDPPVPALTSTALGRLGESEGPVGSTEGVIVG